MHPFGCINPPIHPSIMAVGIAFLSLLLAGVVSSHQSGVLRRSAVGQVPIAAPTLAINGIPYKTRAYWMRQANVALGTPCPFAAFGSVVVNHTAADGLGELVCTGANSNSKTGNPSLHGASLAILRLASTALRSVLLETKLTGSR